MQEGRKESQVCFIIRTTERAKELCCSACRADGEVFVVVICMDIFFSPRLLSMISAKYISSES